MATYNLDRSEVDDIIRNSRDRLQAETAYYAKVRGKYGLRSDAAVTMPSDVYNRINRQFPIQGSGTGGAGGGGAGDGGGKQTFWSSLQENLTKFADGFNKPLAFVAENLSAVVESSLGQYSKVDQDNSIQKIFNLVEKGLLRWDTVGKGFGLIRDEILDQYKQENELLSEINSKTSLTGKLSNQVQGDIKRAAVNAAQFGFTMADIGASFITLVEQSGKFALINEETMTKMAPTARALDMTMSELAGTITTFEKVGIGAKTTLETVGKTLTRSNALGLSGKQIAKDLETNIGKLNEYGFQNGTRGLERMAQKSKEFRMEMSEVFKIADKVFEPDSALELTANLQVLGGAIGDFNDPLKLMYMATNNVEGLQDALIDASKSLATYNSEQGKFEITGINLRRAREMAKQLGVNYEELAKGAIAAAERTDALSQISARGLKMNDKDMEFLTNLARMEDGEMKISIPKSLADELGGDIAKTQKVALSQIDQKTAEALISNRKAFEDMSVEEMSKAQLSEIQQMARDMAVVAAYYKYVAVKEIGESNIVQYLKQSNQAKAPEALKQQSLEKLQQTYVEKIKEKPVSLLEATKNDIMNMLGASKTEETKNININVNKTLSFRSDAILSEVQRNAMLYPEKYESDNEEGSYLSPMITKFKGKIGTA